MRGCLFTLVLGAAVIAGLVAFGLPRLAETLIASSLTTGGLETERTDVVVNSASPVDILRLHADRVTITAVGVRSPRFAASRMELQLEDVDLGRRTARSVSGMIHDAVAPMADGSVAIPTITLDGSLDSLAAVAAIDGASVEALIATRVADATG